MKFNKGRKEGVFDYPPAHIGIIMDGNGRWAKQRLLPRTAGHREGAKRIRDVVDAAIKCHVKEVSFYTFSTENWSRPQEEVRFLFSLLSSFFTEYEKELMEKQVCVRIIGFMDQLPEEVKTILLRVEENTKSFTRLYVNVAFNYGGKRDLVSSCVSIAKKVQAGELKVEDINETVFEEHLVSARVSPIDLLIRTSNEQRISNFFPWQLTYSEFYFMEVLWPDFSAESFYQAIEEYSNRNRRFGGV